MAIIKHGVVHCFSHSQVGNSCDNCSYLEQTATSRACTSHRWHILARWPLKQSSLLWPMVPSCLWTQPATAKTKGEDPCLCSPLKSVLEAWKLPKEKVSCSIQPAEDVGGWLTVKVIFDSPWMKIPSWLVCVPCEQGRSAQRKLCAQERESWNLNLNPEFALFAILLAFQEALLSGPSFFKVPCELSNISSTGIRGNWVSSVHSKIILDRASSEFFFFWWRSLVL